MINTIPRKLEIMPAGMLTLNMKHHGSGNKATSGHGSFAALKGVKRGLATFFTAVVMLLVQSGVSEGTSVTIGTPGGASSGAPFGGFSTSGGTTYQQLYSAAEFSGVMDIGSITFFGDPSSVGVDVMDSANYRIWFSTTTVPIGSIDMDWANNIGADASVFGEFTVSGVTPEFLAFTGTPFNYDPSMGNLLMQVDVLTLSEVDGSGYFQMDIPSVIVNSMQADSGNSTGEIFTAGLVTRFASVPETSSVLLLGSGMLLVLRRRRG